MNARAEGFSLVELLVVVLIATFVLGAIYQTIVVQERGNRQQMAIINTHQTNRTVSSVLATELREISAANGDLLDATATSITFRALRKIGFVCAKDELTRSLTVGVRGAPFVSGGSGSVPDVVLVFREDDPMTRTDDEWLSERLVTDASAATPCGAVWPDADATQQLTLSPFDDEDFEKVLEGAPVRSYERLTYRIELVDGNSMLVRVNEGLAQPPQVLIGPLAPLNEGGLRFTYFDAGGTGNTGTLSAAQREKVARIQMSVKGMSRSGAVAGQLNYADSLVTQITLRGN